MDANGKASPAIKDDRPRSRSPISRSSDDKDRRSRDTGDRSRSRNRSRDRTSSRKHPVTRKVYIANISFGCKWTEIKDLFREKVGDVSYVELFEDEDGKFRGCGIVELKDASSVDKAIEVLHRHEFKGRNLVVKEDYDVERDKYGRVIPRGSRGMERSRDRSLEDYRRSRDSGGRGDDRGGDRGSDRERRGGDPPYNNYGLNPDFLASLGINGPLTSRVFVANLEYKVDSRKLHDVFGIAGTVVHVDLNKDSDGNSKGHAVVEFSHPIEAVQCISMLNGQKLYSRAMNMRMDRYNSEPDRSSNKLPGGLQGLGKGLGMDGQPLHLSKLNTNNLGMGTSNLLGSLASVGSATAGGGLGLLGSTGLAGLGGLAGMNSLNSVGSSMGGLSSLGLSMGLGGNSLPGTNERSLMGSALGNPTNLSAGSLTAGMGGGLASLGLGGGGTSGTGLASSMGMSMGLTSGMGQGLGQGLGGSPSMGATNSMMGSSGMGSNDTLGNTGTGGYGGNSSFERSFDRGGTDYSRSPRTSDTVVVRNFPSTFGWQSLRDRFRDIDNKNATNF